MIDNGEQSKTRNGGGNPHQKHPFHTDPVRQPREAEHSENSVQDTKERHDSPDHWGIEPETTECDGRGEEYRLQGTERDVDQRDERVVNGGDDHISREEVAQCRRFLRSFLKWCFRGEKRVFLRGNSLFLSKKEFPNGLRRGVGLLEDLIISLIQYKAVKSANLFKEEKGHEPSNNRESRGHSARKEIRVLLQEFAVAEQAGEPLRRARKCSPDDRSIPNMRRCAQEADSILRIS